MEDIRLSGNFSRCPIKKRPVGPTIVEYETNIVEEEPQDLSIKKENTVPCAAVTQPLPTDPPIYAHESAHQTPVYHSSSPVTASREPIHFQPNLFQPPACMDPRVPYWPWWGHLPGAYRMSPYPAYPHRPYYCPPVPYPGSRHFVGGRHMMSSPPLEDHRVFSPASAVSEDSGIGTEFSSSEEEEEKFAFLNEVQNTFGTSPAQVANPQVQLQEKEDTKSFSNYCKGTESVIAGSSSSRKSYDCKYCEKVYWSHSALNMHVRTHTLPCKCHICGKAFSRPWLLQGHIRTHTGEKPFQCTECMRSFADRSNLRAHLQTHSSTGKKYACSTCPRTFSRLSILNKHTLSACRGKQLPSERLASPPSASSSAPLILPPASSTSS